MNMTSSKKASVNVLSGQFSGYASLFDVPDLSGDVIRRGAFSRSLVTSHSIKMLWQHDPAQPIGKWLDIQEDQRGLYVRGQLNSNVVRASELHALLVQGALDGLSIGFRVQKARTDPRLKTRELLDLDLWEISLVTFPMLPSARVTSVKQEPLAVALQRARQMFETS